MPRFRPVDPFHLFCLQLIVTLDSLITFGKLKCHILIVHIVHHNNIAVLSWIKSLQMYSRPSPPAGIVQRRSKAAVCSWRGLWGEYRVWTSSCPLLLLYTSSQCACLPCHDLLFKDNNYIRNNKKRLSLASKVWNISNYSYLLWIDHELICEDPDTDRAGVQIHKIQQKRTYKRLR